MRPRSVSTVDAPALLPTPAAVAPGESRQRHTPSGNAATGPRTRTIVAMTHGRYAPTTLVLSPHTTTTADAVADAAADRGMALAVLWGSSAPAGLHGTSCLYAARPFGDLVAEPLGLGLLEPPAAWLTDLPQHLTGRHIDLLPIRDAWQMRRPVFIKPADGKDFAAQVYPDGTYLPGADALCPDTLVLISERLTALAEYRLFILDGQVITASRYATHGTLDVLPLAGDLLADEVLGFADTVLRHSQDLLPSAVVIDVGLVTTPSEPSPQWAVIEANAAWSSGVYGCDTVRVLETVVRSAGPLDAVTARDRLFLR